MNSEIVSQTPLWYVLLCAGLGIAFAFFYYYKSKVFSKSQKRILAIIRSLLTFGIAFLLLNPLIKTVSSIIEKPKVLLLVDNSKSMSAAKSLKDISNGILALKKEIEDKGFEFEIKDFDDKTLQNLEAKDFYKRTTDINAALNLARSNYEGQNLSDLILLSDGIINEGVSPTFQKFPFNVHTIGFGDTTKKKDAFISGVSANKLAYLGNNFPVSVDLCSYLLKGQKAKLSVLSNEGAVLAEKVVTYTSDDDFQTQSFELTAKSVGKQRFVVKLQVLNGEKSVVNNQRDFIVDIVNGREKILLLAYSPHPDIKAIKSIVESNDLFELKTIIVDQSNVNSLQNEPFDILVLHQFPDKSNLHSQFLVKLLSKQKPTFFILGSQSNLSYFNGMQNILSIATADGKVDKVTAKVNPAFSMFSIGEGQTALIAKLPPVTVPFGTYKLLAGSETILDQFVGGINAGRPLLALNLAGTRKMAAFIAEGLWQWRLEEYALTESQQHLDDLFVKTLQLISVKEDKGKLRVYPIAPTFDIEQNVVFTAEVYNKIFERIYNQDIKLKIRNQKSPERNYEFKVTETESRFQISKLPAGVYNFEASSKVLNKGEVSIGQFVVTASDLEMQNTVADFDLLKTLANENNGDFVEAKNSIELRNTLEKRGLINKISAKEDLQDIINLKWLLFVILSLAATEWVFRKYLGSY